MNHPLCKDCANKDSAYIVVGAHYEEQEICIYTKPHFPNAHSCNCYAKDETE